MPQFDNSLVLQFALGAGHCVGVHEQIFSQSPDGGKLIAGSESAGFDGVADLLHQLETEWCAGRMVEAEEHQVY
jgi:hypothetical protein